MRTPGSSRINEFEALRGLMALWVVVGHVIHTVDLGPEPAAWLRLLSRNPYAVNVFIALSGFVIYALIDQKREPYSLYIGRRGLRLFPAYLFFLILSVMTMPIALDVLAADVPGNDRAVARVAYLEAGQQDFWAHLLGHLVLLHGLVPQAMLPEAEYTLLGQGWSISVEWQFYLVAPFLYLAFERNALLASLGLGAVTLASYRWLGDIANNGFVGFYLHYFLLGILAYLVWRRRPLLSAWQFWGIVFGCAGGAIATVRAELSLSIWLAAFAATLLLHRPGGGWPARAGHWLVDNPVAQFLGRISYSVYLSHMVVMFPVAWALRAIAPGQPLSLAALLAGTMAGTLLLSHLTYVWIEHPCIQLGKALRQRPRLPASLASPG